MKSTSLKIERNREKGIALLTALFAIMLLSAIAFGMVYMSTTEQQVNNNFRDSQTAYFAARSGIEEMRERMRPGSTNPITLPTTSPTTTGGVVYLLNPDSTGVKPWDSTNAYFDTELAHENYYTPTIANPGSAGGPCTASSCVPTGTYYTTANALTSSNTIDFKWARLTHKTNSAPNDMSGSDSAGTSTYTRMVDVTRYASASDFHAPVCYDENSTSSLNANGPLTYGKQTLMPSGETVCVNHTAGGSSLQWQPVYNITALAVTSTGARRMLEAEVAKLVYPALPASLVLDGPLPNGNYNGLSSANSGIKGIDRSAAAPCVTGGAKPSIGTFDTPSVGNVTLSNPIATNYTGSPNGASNIGSSGSNLLGSLGTVSGLNAMMSSLQSTADYTGCSATNASPACSPATTASFSTDPANPKITYVNGNFDYPHNTDGYGILVVTGDFTMAGNSTWTGLIIVVGTGSYTQAGTSSVYGNVLVANTRTGVVGDTPGSPYINFNGGGGSGGIYYDSCAAVNTQNKAAFKIIGMKELPY